MSIRRMRSSLDIILRYGSLAIVLLAPTTSLYGAAAADKAADKAVDASTDIHLGLTIVGDRETPLGLFITPWKNAYPPERGDRPALLLDEAALPLDADTFHRQSLYDEAFSTYRRTGTVP